MVCPFDSINHRAEAFLGEEAMNAGYLGRIEIHFDRTGRKRRFQERNKLSILGCFLLFAFVMVSLIATGNAQIAGTGSIQGSVSDSSGALLPGAAVTIIKTDTQTKREAVSGRDGLYSFPNIDIGTYTLSVAAPGFKTYSQQN